MPARDPYRILGVPRHASRAQIEAAYRRLAKRYHPDRNKGPDANARMAEINWAYELLTHPDRRGEFDRAHPDSPPPATPAPPTRPPVGEVGKQSRRPVPRRAPGSRLGRFLSSLLDEPLAHPWALALLAVVLAYLIYAQFPDAIEPPRHLADLALGDAMTSVARLFAGPASVSHTPLPPAPVGTPLPPNDFASECVSVITARRYVGQSACVYGYVNRIASAGDGFEFEFIGPAPGLVAHSATQSWPDLNPRECVAAFGALVAEGDRLVLNLAPNGLARCP